MVGFEAGSTSERAYEYPTKTFPFGICPNAARAASKHSNAMTNVIRTTESPAKCDATEVQEYCLEADRPVLSEHSLVLALESISARAFLRDCLNHFQKGTSGMRKACPFAIHQPQFAMKPQFAYWNAHQFSPR